MSGHFPRLNLDRPADLDHVIHAVDRHAHKVAQMEFGSELERDKALKAVVDKMIKRVSLGLCPLPWRREFAAYVCILTCDTLFLP